MTPPPFFHLVRELTSAVNVMKDPGEAMAMLTGGMIANLIGPIHDDQWRRMMMIAAEPCGRPGCRCEMVASQLMDALDVQREDWKEVIREGGAR